MAKKPTTSNPFAAKEPMVEIIDFTPDFARQALGLVEDPKGLIRIGKERYTAKNNNTNRPIRPSAVKSYTQEMLNGNWNYTGDSMTFNTRGNAVSLQHRCYAILKAEEEIRKQPQRYSGVKLSFPQVVAYGVRPKDADYADKGVSRNPADVIFRNGTFKDMGPAEAKKVSSDLGTAQRLLWTRLNGRFVKGSGKQAHSEVLSTLNEHPRLEEAVRFIVKLDSAERNDDNEEIRASGSISHKLSRGYAACLLYLFASSVDNRDLWEEGKDLEFKLWEEACQFFTEFAEPYELSKGNPVIALHRRRDAMQKADNTNRDEIVTAVVKAWNAWVNDEEMTSANDLKLKRVEGELEYAIAGGLDIGPVETVIPGDEDEAPDPE